MADDPARRNAMAAETDRIDIVTRLNNATPAQINTWVDNNVTDLASVKTVLKAILKAISLDWRV